MPITISAKNGTVKHVLKAVRSASCHESLNGERTLSIQADGRQVMSAEVGDVMDHNGMLYDIVRVSRRAASPATVCDIGGEHVSYRLTDIPQDSVHLSGTAAELLAALLAGTGFSAGTVEFAGERTLTVQSPTNKRDALMRWAQELGAEVDYSGWSIHLLQHVGRSAPAELSEKKNVTGIQVTMDARSASQTYAVTLWRETVLGLGDELTITYPTLPLSVSTRIIAMDYDPFRRMQYRLTTGDYVPDWTASVAAGLEGKLGEGKPYFGVVIDREHGIRITRSDGKSEAVFNSDLFSMRALIDGVMKDRIYFDPIKGDYIFDGALGADAVFTDSLYAETGEVAELTVDRLSTSRRIRKYILGDKSDDNYVRIQDQYIQFVTGTLVYDAVLWTESGVPILTEDGEPILLDISAESAVTVQAQNRYGQGLYWQREPVGHTSDGYPTDIDGVQIYAGTDETDWPVYVWQYTELVKAQFAFEEYTTTQGDRTYAPVIQLGAGDENGNSKGYLLKEQNEMIVRYLTGAGEMTDIRLSDFVDAKHRRLASLDIDTVNGEVAYTVEGDDNEYGLTFEVDGDTVTYTWPDGHECVVNVT